MGTGGIIQKLGCGSHSVERRIICKFILLMLISLITSFNLDWNGITASELTHKNHLPGLRVSR
jgi:hypothetical protein